MMFELLVISLCGLLSIAISWTRSPFMSLMYAVMLFINASVVLLMLGFEFLALVNLLVYVGALAVLFLFVIMLLEIPATELRAYARGWSTLALLGILGSKLFMLLVPTDTGVDSSSGVGFPIHHGGQSPNPTMSYIPAMESISSLGEALYIRYSDLLILNSMVLTIALFGALVLAHIRL